MATSNTTGSSSSSGNSGSSSRSDSTPGCHFSVVSRHRSHRFQL